MLYEVVYDVRIRVRARVEAASREDALDARTEDILCEESDGGLFLDTSRAEAEIIDVDPRSADAVEEADRETEEDVAPSPVPW